MKKLIEFLNVDEDVFSLSERDGWYMVCCTEPGMCYKQCCICFKAEDMKNILESMIQAIDQEESQKEYAY